MYSIIPRSDASQVWNPQNVRTSQMLETLRNKGMICHDFFQHGTAGCRLPNCPYMHVRPGEEWPVPDSLCLFYQKGACLRDKCRFFHGSQPAFESLRRTEAPTYRPQDYMLFASIPRECFDGAVAGSAHATINQPLTTLTNHTTAVHHHHHAQHHQQQHPLAHAPQMMQVAPPPSPPFNPHPQQVPLAHHHPLPPQQPQQQQIAYAFPPTTTYTMVQMPSTAYGPHSTAMPQPVMAPAPHAAAGGHHHPHPQHQPQHHPPSPPQATMLYYPTSAAPTVTVPQSSHHHPHAVHQQQLYGFLSPQGAIQ